LREEHDRRVIPVSGGGSSKLAGTPALQGQEGPDIG
jgi:hypothetical protein